MELSIDALFQLLDSQVFNPEGQLIQGLTITENFFYNHLPLTFNYNQAVEIGRRLKCSRRTVDHHLNSLQACNCLLKITRGHYMKITPPQRNLPHEIILRQECLVNLIRTTQDPELLDKLINQLSPENE